MAAHREAVEKAGILHRDISAGNLLICEYKSKDANGSPERRGLLTDWELSKPLKELVQRQPERTVSDSLDV